MSPARMERLESGLRLVLQFAEVVNRRDRAALERLLNPACLYQHYAPAPGGSAYRGKAAVADFWNTRFQGLPAAWLQVEEVFGSGPRCVLRWRDESGLRGLSVFQVRDGLIGEILSYVKAEAQPPK